MHTLEILQAGRALISEPDRWCTEDSARDANGEACAANDVKACRWCSIGALQKAAGRDNATYDYVSQDRVHKATLAALRALGHVAGELENCSQPMVVWLYNDNHTHEEVMRMWDLAIERAKAQSVDPTI